MGARLQHSATYPLAQRDVRDSAREQTLLAGLAVNQFLSRAS
jgi:hypothetical protein